MLPSIEEADRHVADSKRRIDEQRRRIFEMQRRGEDTTTSANLLAGMIRFLAIAEMRRETLQRLAQSELSDGEITLNLP